MFYKDYPHGRVYQGDCLEVLKVIRGYDHVLTDPPYNIKLADRDTFESDAHYCDFMYNIFKTFDNELKTTSNIIWFHNEINKISLLIEKFRSLENFYLRTFSTWDKSTWYRNNLWDGRNADSMNRSLFNVCEYFLVYNQEKPSEFLGDMHSDPKKFRQIKDYMISQKNAIKEKNGWNTAQFNEYVNELTGTSCVVSRHYFCDSQWVFPTEEIYKKLQTAGAFCKNFNTFQTEHTFFRKEYETLRKEYETTRPIFNLPKECKNIFSDFIQDREGTHPCEKPQSLLSKLLLIYSNEGDTILDPFIGSGSTAIACAKNNRKFIGIEILPEYYKLTCDRLDNYYDGRLNFS